MVVSFHHLLVREVLTGPLKILDPRSLSRGERLVCSVGH